MVSAHALVAAAGYAAQNVTLAALGEEEKYDLSGSDRNYAVLVIATVVIMITICFEALKDYLYEETNEELQPIIRKMFEELTVLGFIGLVVFVIVKFKVMRMIEHSVFSSSKDKDDEGTALTELTENIHMVVFLVAVIFLVQVLLLVYIGSRTKTLWRDFEIDVDAQVEERAAKELARAYYFYQKKSWLHRVLSPLEYLDILFKRQKLEYVALRARFLSSGVQKRSTATDLESPEEAQVKKHISPDFDFAEYLILILGETLAELVEVTPKTWAIVWIIFVFFWGLLMVNEALAMYSILVLGFVLVLLLSCMYWKLSWIRRMLLPPRHFTYTNQLVEAWRADLAHESTPLLAASLATTMGNVQIQALRASGSVGVGVALNSSNVPDLRADEDLYSEPPPYVSRPLPQAPRSKIKRWLMGLPVNIDVDNHHKPHEIRPDRHEILFWFARRGPPFIVVGLRVAMVLVSLSVAVFCVGFAKRISTYHPARAAVMFLVEVLPVLILPFLYRAIMICYVQVANVECMREGRVIMRVIRMQKTRTTLRVLKLLSSLRKAKRRSRRVARDLTTMSSDEVERPVTPSLDAGRRNSIARRASTVPGRRRANQEFRDSIMQAFNVIDKDGSGQVSDEELEKLLRDLGVATTPDEVADIMDELDADGSGVVDREEFFQWMEQYHEAQSAENLSPHELVESIFEVLDRDGSGSVSAEELRQTLTTLGEDLSTDDIVSIIAEVDADGDGNIDREEFEKMIIAHYEYIA